MGRRARRPAIHRRAGGAANRSDRPL